MVALFFRSTKPSRGVLEFVELGLRWLDEFGLRDEELFLERLRQSIGQHGRNHFRLAGVNRDRKGAGVAIVAINRAVGFPDAIGVAGGVVFVAHEQDLGPEVLVEAVLGSDHGEIIAGRDDAAIEDNEIVFRGNESDRLLAGSERESGREDERKSKPRKSRKMHNIANIYGGYSTRNGLLGSVFLPARS